MEGYIVGIALPTNVTLGKCIPSMLCVVDVYLTGIRDKIALKMCSTSKTHFQRCVVYFISREHGIGQDVFNAPLKTSIFAAVSHWHNSSTSNGSEIRPVQALSPQDSLQRRISTP